MRSGLSKKHINLLLVSGIACHYIAFIKGCKMLICAGLVFLTTYLMKTIVASSFRIKVISLQRSP